MQRFLTGHLRLRIFWVFFNSDFKAVTTHEPISLSDYNGQWVMHALACNEILSCPEFFLPHPLQALFLP
jgi:hypothetical protein